MLEWASKFGDRVFAAVPIAGAPRHSAQNIAFHEVGRQAIMADPDWCQGDYMSQGKRPRRGLAVARMEAHITYLSEAALHRKFGRRLQEREAVTYGFDADFEVESYLRHQGSSFVDRFDPNAYLYITRAMDYFDMAGEHDGVLGNAFRDTKVRYCLVSFSSDVHEIQGLGQLDRTFGASIRGLTAGGGTMLYDAVAHAFWKLKQQHDPQRINVIVAMTDGQSQGDIGYLELSVREADFPVLIFTVAYGEDADLDVLKRIARMGDGQAYPSDPETIEKLYQLLSAFF